MQEIHLWVPELDAARGGIQAFSQHLHQALGRIVMPGVRVRTLAKLGTGPLAGGHQFGGVPAWLRTPIYAAALLRAGLYHRPMLVIATHVNFLPVARLLKRWRGVRYVGVAHGVEVWGSRRAGVQRSLREADSVLAVSRYTQGRVAAEQQLPAERVKVLPNTFDPADFQPRPKPLALLRRYGLSADAKIIFSFGRLAASERYKGFDRVIAALPEICRRVPNARYLIGGTGDDRPRLEQLTRDSGLAGRVVFTGFIAPEEVCDHYNLCDVFAMPSVGEGFGIVYLEAMACGRPVLAGNRDGSTEPLRDGELGALVDPESPAQIADALARILEGRHEHPLMFQPAPLRERIVREFGFDRFCRTLAGHLRPLLPPGTVCET